MILDLIAGSNSLSQLMRYVEEHASSDAAHDIGHALRVADWTLRLVDGAVPAPLCIAAALLHDIVDIPKNHRERTQASERSAAVARAVLEDCGFVAADIDLVTDAIRDHSFSRGAVPASLLGKALQDADRLEALGVIGTFRCIATGARIGARFFDALDPWAKMRDLDDARFSIDHFFTKLLTLPSTFHTEHGRREAGHRSATMRSLLVALGREIGVEYAPEKNAAGDCQA